ncbi:hypothetical protein [Halorubrum sp. HHNYT27]
MATAFESAEPESRGFYDRPSQVDRRRRELSSFLRRYAVVMTLEA